MPCLISGNLIWDRRARTDKRHLSPEHIQELWELIQAALSQEFSNPRDPQVIHQLVHTLPIPIRWFLLCHTVDKPGYILFVHTCVVTHMHGTKFEECKTAPVMTNTLLPEEHRPSG